jgi:hypothetical protein
MSKIALAASPAVRCWFARSAKNNDCVVCAFFVSARGPAASCCLTTGARTGPQGSSLRRVEQWPAKSAGSDVHDQFWRPPLADQRLSRTG